MRVRVKHETSYLYPSDATFGPHFIRLRPAGHTKAKVLAYNLDVSPDCALWWLRDPWNNLVARATFGEDVRARALRITVDLTLNIQPVNPFDFQIDDRCEYLPMRYPDGLETELGPFLAPGGPVGPLLAEFVEQVPLKGKFVDYLVALNQAVSKRVHYVIRTEVGLQTAEETLEKNSGSCRDSAVLLMDALRARGFAARFVSGYLVQLADEGIIPDQAKGIDHDAVDLHAWAEVYVPGAGWIGIDGTSGLFCGEGHIPLAATVNPEAAAPITGTAAWGEGDPGFEFAMSVTRIGHEARPRVPYTDETWAEIIAAGKAIDETITSRGLAMTSGGEPTWTSRRHSEEPEWITEALGETKWMQSLELVNELSLRLADGICSMRRMGKLYPGESMPRWIMDMIWRKDGIPIWKRAELRATKAPSKDPKVDLPLLDTAQKFAELVAGRLGIEPHVQPGYEDPWHFIMKEENLPEDVDPLKADLEDSEDRRRLARVLGRGLGQPAGYVLPVHHVDERWIGANWTFRRGDMFLTPGDFPMGLRMPLDRIGGKPFQAPEKDVTAVEEDLPADPRTGLHQFSTEPLPSPEAIIPKEKKFRTAVCVEPRGGVLYVFLPPIESGEGWLELVSVVEDTAAELGVPVCLEGYPPPSDPRFRSCGITPDPGVVEVNMPVCSGFDEYRQTLEIVADAANHAGLRMEKYQLDGREAGSGGGNHITLGGQKAVESPFLIRPDLLGSLLRYVQNHPAMSYLFTGLFVGPTSEAPRLDEARFDSLYELELALAQIPKPGEKVFPWLTDRLLRNLLTDVAGNTHRTEISIDKLYSPMGPTGRLGLVEMRAFEMPPHERMAALQMLLARGLMARFAKDPYEEGLIRWGNRLHDRFMLPHYLWGDMKDIARDLRHAELPFDLEWFRPFLDFRYPMVGVLELEDMMLELRTAAEPWPTLGDSLMGPTVARPVDSSLERIQVRATGLTEGRHVISVNGIELPMFETGKASELVAGVRFRAWQPPHCLQPNLPIQHPLHFDIIDTWGKRSLGRCNYHVIHPEGVGFDAPPLTPFEAGARRAQRFTVEGCTPWPVKLQRAEPSQEQPVTLDLRRYAVPRPPDDPSA